MTQIYFVNGGFGKTKHELLAELLHDIKGKFLISYNDCELVRELYKDFKIVSTKEIKYTLSAASDKSVKEVFIMNY